MKKIEGLNVLRVTLPYVIICDNRNIKINKV